MKQTEKVSIGGYAFTLEQDAAAEAESYLNQMAAYYTNPEITDGIEERMAELLRERVPEGGAVSKATILAVIDILGRPELIARDQPEPEPEVKPARKLYRDMENARIAGVCSGLGAYFKFDPLILRLVFAVLTLVSVFGLMSINGVISMAVPLAYVILWICIPPARTAQQRWQLRGDDGSAESVRRNVERGSGDVGAALHQVGNSPAWGTLGRILEVIIGLILLITAVSGLFAGALAAFGWQWLGLGGTLTDLLTDAMDTFPQSAVIINTLWVKILACAVYALPFIGMLYGSIMMLFRIKSPSWHPGLVILVLWILAVIALIILVCACCFSIATA